MSDIEISGELITVGAQDRHGDVTLTFRCEDDKQVTITGLPQKDVREGRLRLFEWHEITIKSVGYQPE